MVKRSIDRFLLASMLLLGIQLQTAIPAPRQVRDADVTDLINVLRVPTKDSYAFYSELYKDLKGIEYGEVVAFAAKPKPFPSSVMCPPKVRSSEDELLLQQAKGAVSNEALWHENFDIKQPYIVVPEVDVAQAIDCVQSATRQRSLTSCERYKDVRAIRFISIPAFNPRHTRALVAISRVCGGLCGDGGVSTYLLKNGHWEQEPNSFAYCRWVN